MGTIGIGTARGALGWALAIALLAPAGAEAFVGTGTVTGGSRLAVRGCGRSRATLAVVVTVRDDGTWSATGPDATFTGTSTAVGRSGRRLRLVLDAPSTDAMVASLVEEIVILCDAPAVTVTSVQPKAVTLSLDRRRAKAKLLVRYVVRGTANGESGKAIYRILGRGAWTPG